MTLAILPFPGHSTSHIEMFGRSCNIWCIALHLRTFVLKLVILSYKCSFFYRSINQVTCIEDPSACTEGWGWCMVDFNPPLATVGSMKPLVDTSVPAVIRRVNLQCWLLFHWSAFCCSSVQCLSSCTAGSSGLGKRQKSKSSAGQYV